MSAQGLANSLWAPGVLSHPDILLVEAATSGEDFVDELSPQNSANSLQALGTLTHRNQPGVSAIAAAAMTRVDQLTPQGLANIA